MTTLHERSAGVIPFRLRDDRSLQYLVLHSALVRNPRAKWEFPKGTIEPGESPRAAAAREFLEETGITRWQLLDDFEQQISYSYLRRGQRIFKTVTYYLGHVHDDSDITRSEEHVPNDFGHWYTWGGFDRVSRMLYHAKIRQLFEEADRSAQRYVRGLAGRGPDQPTPRPPLP